MRTRLHFILRALVSLLICTGPAVAAAQSDPGSSSSPADLKPGRFIWHPDPAASGPVAILVSLGRQRAYVFRSETLIGMSTISTGKEGYETPPGRYHILQKR